MSVVSPSLLLRLVFGMPVSPRVCFSALALLLSAASISAGQEARVSFRTTSFNGPTAAPLFKVDIVETPKNPTAALPSVTVVETPQGPRMSNVTLKLPPLTLGDTPVAPVLGDQTLPRTFSSSPLAGNGVRRPMRGLSFSTTGPTPVNLVVGQLDATSRPPTQAGNTPGVVAVSMGVASSKELSVTQRALVPVGPGTTQATVGTAIRAEVNKHVSVTSDVGAAGNTQQGWDPLAAAGVIGHWSGAELETNLLRGMSPIGSPNLTTVGSLDREVVRGVVRSIPGMTISTQASWSRPASSQTSADTTAGTVGVAYDRLPIGVLVATRLDDRNPVQDSDTMRVEWRRKAVGGVAVRYVQREDSPHDRSKPIVVSNQVEVELPAWIDRDVRNRLDVQAVLTENPAPGMPTVSSRLSGRFDLVGTVGVYGDTEVGITNDGPSLRALRLTSSVPVRDRTAVQLVYTYMARGPYSYENQSFEARLSRSIPLVGW